MERITRVRVGIVLAIFMLILGFFALKLFGFKLDPFAVVAHFLPRFGGVEIDFEFSRGGGEENCKGGEKQCAFHNISIP